MDQTPPADSRRTERYSSDWVTQLEDEHHFLLYREQAELVYADAERSDLLLELGCGSMFLTDLLRRRGFQVRTLDIDPAKHPDYCADAAAFDFTTEPFTHLIAFEVFEHIPWPTLQEVVGNLADSAINTVVFSVPWAGRWMQPVSIRIPRGPELAPTFVIPRTNYMTKHHYWELARSERHQRKSRHELHRVEELDGVFRDAGFRVALNQQRGVTQFFTASRR